MDDSPQSPPTPGSIAAIIPAAGSGSRLEASVTSCLRSLTVGRCGTTSAARLRQQSLVGRIVMAVSESDRNVFDSEFADQVAELNIELVQGARSEPTASRRV